MRQLFIILLSTTTVLFAQGKMTAQPVQDDSVRFIASQAISFNEVKYALNDQAERNDAGEMQSLQEQRSGRKAAIMSAILPGAGEVYAKSYWRAALFAGIEIALWTSNVINDKKGDDEDVRMRAFGDVHWSEHVYWSKLYRDGTASTGLSGALPDYELDTNQLLVGFDAEMANTLRFLERELGYTHSLPETKTQQYYEMIYKYLHQFGAAWDDVPFLEFYDNTANLSNLTPNIEKYRSMRNRSNDYYQTATMMLNLVLVNHLLSAFDAAIAVKQFNKKLQYAVRVNQQYYGMERLTTYGLYVSW